MFLINWFWDVLSSLGLYNKKARILFLGLDNAGKTTLLHMLRDGKLVLHEPTRYPQSEELAMGGIRFRTHDLGGHKAARRLWKEYFASVNGIVFLVDAAEPERFTEAQEEIYSILSDESVKDVPFLVLGNKVDLKTAVDEHTLKEQLGVSSICTGKDKDSKVPTGIRPFEVYMSSVVKKFGYVDGFKWLSNHIVSE